MFEKIFSAISAVIISISTLVGGQKTELVPLSISSPTIEVSPVPEILSQVVENTPDPTVVPTPKPTLKPTAKPSPVSTPVPTATPITCIELSKKLAAERVEAMKPYYANQEKRRSLEAEYDRISGCQSVSDPTCPYQTAKEKLPVLKDLENQIIALRQQGEPDPRYQHDGKYVADAKSRGECI